MNFQDVRPSIPNDNFRDQCVLVFGLTSLEEATESSHHPKLAAEPQRQELNDILPLDHVNELVLLGYRKNQSFRFQLTSLMLLETISKNDNVARQQKINCILPLTYRYSGPIPSNYVSTRMTFLLIYINSAAVCRASSG